MCVQFADNEDLQSMWKEAKRINKLKVVSFLKEKTGYLVSPDAMFDVQVIFCPGTVYFVDKKFNNFYSSASYTVKFFIHICITDQSDDDQLLVYFNHVANKTITAYIL